METLSQQENPKRDVSQTQATASNDSPPQDIKIVGRLGRYRSSYWEGLVAALGVRYLPRPFWRDHFTAPPEASYFNKHKYSAFAGGLMTGVAGFYAVRTWSDIKNICAEAVGWEKGKDKKDVGLFDMWTSDNSVVKQTINNYIKYNVRRFAINAVYFLPFIPGIKQKLFQKYNLNGETGVDWGVAANAAYLFSDVVGRKATPFEELQSLIDRKINHAEHFADTIEATDLLDIYERHAKGDANKTFMTQRGTPKWDQSIAVFSRMTDLINQHYHNNVPHEQANFSFSHFIYMMGHGMINPDRPNETLACIEIANQQGVKEAERALAHMKVGSVIQKAVNAPVVPTAINMNKQPLASFSDRITAQAKDAQLSSKQLSF